MDNQRIIDVVRKYRDCISMSDTQVMRIWDALSDAAKREYLADASSKKKESKRYAAGIKQKADI